jgi:hypothetical protein
MKLAVWTNDRLLAFCVAVFCRRINVRLTSYILYARVVKYFFQFLGKKTFECGVNGYRPLAKHWKTNRRKL